MLLTSTASSLSDQCMWCTETAIFFSSWNSKIFNSLKNLHSKSKLRQPYYLYTYMYTYLHIWIGGKPLLIHQIIVEDTLAQFPNISCIYQTMMATRLLSSRVVSQGWEHIVLCHKGLWWKVKKKKKESGTGRLSPDTGYAALNIVLLNINFSIRPSYLKDRTEWSILPISLLWLNLEVHSHSCSYITEWW